MNFFDRQAQARRRSRLLLLYFIPTVVLIILALYGITVMAFGPRGTRLWIDNGWDLAPQIFLLVATLTLAVITIGSLIKFSELSDGGRVVAIALGGSVVSPATTDPDERRLLDVVQEMSIAAGVAVPELFILREEEGINSFVAGHSPEDTALAVTKGALKLLDRDELQGVIAHEFSHILNGDNSLNMRMMGLLHGIVSIAILGKLGLRITSKEGGNSKGSSYLMAMALVLLIIGSIGSFFAMIIKCAVCRRREELADASAVQFTRNPQGIASALKKIGGLTMGSHILAAGSDEADFIFFGELNHSSFWSFLQTHPPLEKRIKLLDPAFDGKYPRILSWRAQQQKAGIAPEVPKEPRIIKLGDALIPILSVKPQAPSPEHITYAAGLCASFDENIQSAAQDPFTAGALVYAALLSDTENERNKQFSDVETIANPAQMRQATQFYPSLETLSPGQKLALINLVLPALRQLSKAQFESFVQTVNLLCESDRALTLFEFTLQKILLRDLKHSFEGARIPIAQYYAVSGLIPQCEVLLSMLAWHGNTDESEIQKAFQAGVNSLTEAQKPMHLLPRENCTLSSFDKALNTVILASTPVKAQILGACAATVASDGLVQEKEAELLRAIAASLNCPLPPFLGQLQSAE